MADISIVTLDSADTLNAFRCWRNLVFTSASVGYLFYVDANSDFVYVKTTDGGQTWGSPNTIRTGTVRHFDVWYDQWTDGDSGTLIHTSYMDDAVDDQFYRSLDTSGDGLGTERTIKASTSASVAVSTSTSIAKMRGGNLYCVYKIATASSKFYTSRSTDGGVNWSDRTTVWDSGSTSSSDFACVFPGNEADSNDAWAIFQDVSTNEIFLKVIDDSADTVSTSSNIFSINETTADGLQQWQWAGAIRHSDGHLILAAWSDLDLTVPFDGDFRVFDINGTGSITELTAIASNVPGAYLSAVFVDQNTDDLYVAYGGKLDGTENIVTFPAKIYYAKSTDGGSTWSTNQAFSASSSDYRSVRVPPSGNRFMGIWRNATTFELLTNYDNSLDLTPAGGTDVTATPAVIAFLSSAQASTPSGGASLSASLQALTGSQPSSYTISGTCLVETSSEVTGTLTPQGAEAGVFALIEAISQNATVSLQALSVTGDALYDSSLPSLTASLPSPELQGGALYEVSPPQVLTSSLLSCGVSGDCLLGANVAALTGSPLSPSLSGDCLVTPQEETMTGALGSPLSISGDGLVALSPFTVVSSFPTLTLSGDSLVETGHVTSTLSGNSPGIATQTLVSPGTPSLLISCLLGDVTGDSLLEASPLSGALTSLSPSATGETRVLLADPCALTGTLVPVTITILQYEGPFIISCIGLFLPGPIEAQVVTESSSIFDVYIPGPVEFEYYLPGIVSSVVLPGPEESLLL